MKVIWNRDSQLFVSKERYDDTIARELLKDHKSARGARHLRSMLNFAIIYHRFYEKVFPYAACWQTEVVYSKLKINVRGMRNKNIQLQNSMMHA